jgi:mannose-6-phosphate isomerase-like protein (cupin superfamily)
MRSESDDRWQMKRTELKFPNGFHVVTGNASSQAASMVIQPGGSEGGPNNSHGGADQWLLILAGSGEAVVNAHRYDLKQGSLVLIERGDTHEIRNTGPAPLKTLNFYVPPAYSADGDELPPGRADAKQ